MWDDEAPTLDEGMPARAERIASGADRIPESEREVWLQKACGSETDLRRSVDAIRARRSSRSEPLLGDLETPQQIGPYRFLEPLGEGGMGVVWLAEQAEPIVRRVAIKLIRGDFRGAARHRFEVERRTLAQMDHPAIARVYEAGDSPSGRPYLVMEYVDGAPLDTWCEREKLDLEARLRLFVQVARGVHHAHQKGVIHRDLKPQNVLVTVVDGEPQPRIIDFGVARWLDDDEDLRVTRRGAVVGTPAYLSPEAVMASEGEVVDLRSDVYSLGVLLYGLLVSDLPFEVEGESFVSLLRRVTEEEAEPPSRRFRSLPSERQEKIAAGRSETASSLVRRIRGDLDAIVTTALARDPEDRYGSAADLASDVERFLENRPIEAMQRGRWHRTRMFVRRHRTGVLAALLLVLSLVGGLVARTLEARRADREAAAARRAETEAREVIDFLVGLFELADPARSLGESVTARELLDRGAGELRRDLADQPAARARLLDTIGLVYERLGLYDSAEQILNEALALRRLDGMDPLERAETLVHLGQVFWQRGESERATRSLTEALELREAALGERSLPVAEILDALGMVEEVAARFEEAEPLLREALAIREALSGPRSIETAETLSHLAILELDRRNAEEAEPILRRVLSIREEILPPTDPQIARALNGLAISLNAQGRRKEAIEAHRRALAIRERSLGSEHTEVGQTLNNLASVLRSTGETQEALALAQRALAVWEKALGPENPRTAIALFGLAEIERDLGRVEEAESLLRRCLRLVEEGRGADHPHVAYTADNLADLLVDDGRLEEAEKLYRRALAILSARFGPGSDAVVDTARSLAGVLRETGRPAEARELELRSGVGVDG